MQNAHHPQDNENQLWIHFQPTSFPRTRKEHCSSPERRYSPFSPSPGNDTRWYQYHLGLGHTHMAPGPTPSQLLQKLTRTAGKAKAIKRKCCYNNASPIQWYLKFMSRVALAHQWQKKHFSLWISQQRWKGGRKERQRQSASLDMNCLSYSNKMYSSDMGC